MTNNYEKQTMDVHLKFKNVSGIYCIQNLIDNKVYIGKSTNLYKRLVQHKSCLNNKKTKQENQYFINAWHKHKSENFCCFLLEEIKNKEDSYFKERELYYMDLFKSNDRNFGYNIRRDSATNMIVSEETKIKMSKSHKQKHLDFPELKLKFSENTKLLWKDLEKLEQMKKNLSVSKRKYKFAQYDKKTKNLIKIYNTTYEILEDYPDFYIQAIYSCCRKEKKSYRGFIWEYVPL